MKQIKHNTAGFTLIELVVVIVILGILAATIVPRFTNLHGDARASVVTGMEASVRSAASMYHGAKLASGLAAGVGLDGIKFEGIATGTTVTDANHYPTATLAGINALVDDSSGDFTAAVVGGNYTWRYTGATTPANCGVTYTAAAAGSPPIISVVTSNCL